jgi:hypothetical protein
MWTLTITGNDGERTTMPCTKSQRDLLSGLLKDETVDRLAALMEVERKARLFCSALKAVIREDKWGEFSHGMLESLEQIAPVEIMEID